jgi:uracil-DNA glycosylase
MSHQRSLDSFFHTSQSSRKRPIPEPDHGRDAKPELLPSNAQPSDSSAQSPSKNTSEAIIEEPAMKIIRTAETAAFAANAATFAKLELLLDPTWAAHVQSALKAPTFAKLKQFLAAEEAKGKKIYPPVADVFSCFAACPFESTKVCILGQDPYHQPGQAHGMSFSVKPGVRIPPSLVNMFKEAGVAKPPHGYLMGWARQGVLLLNAVMTVEDSNAGSHAGKGWEPFTDAIIAAISAQHAPGVVFFLWGNHAKKKGAMIDRKKHHVLEAAHPSPLSAHNGFMGCGHFQKCNELLAKHGKAPIQWDFLPES